MSARVSTIVPLSQALVLKHNANASAGTTNSLAVERSSYVNYGCLICSSTGELNLTKATRRIVLNGVRCDHAASGIGKRKVHWALYDGAILIKSHRPDRHYLINLDGHAGGGADRNSC